MYILDHTYDFDPHLDLEYAEVARMAQWNINQNLPLSMVDDLSQYIAYVKLQQRVHKPDEVCDVRFRPALKKLNNIKVN